MNKKLKNIFVISFISILSIVFVDKVGAETYNNYTDSLVSCGDSLLTNIPTLIPKVISILYTLIQVLVPIVLVIFGMLDLFKGITAGKEDDMKKGQQLFIKRIIVAAIIFFVFVFVKLLVSFVADSDKSRIINCAECFIKNDCTVQKVKS